MIIIYCCNLQICHNIRLLCHRGSKKLFFYFILTVIYLIFITKLDIKRLITQVRFKLEYISSLFLCFNINQLNSKIDFFYSSARKKLNAPGGIFLGAAKLFNKRFLLYFECSAYYWKDRSIIYSTKVSSIID